MHIKPCPAGSKCLPLVQAVRGGKINIISERLQKCDDVNAQCECGTTALHWAACFHGNEAYPPEIIELLLAHGADINIEDCEKRNPLVYALYSPNPDISLLKSMSDSADVSTIERVLQEGCWRAIKPLHDHLCNLLKEKRDT